MLACVHTLSLSCVLALCDPMNCSLPSFSVHRISQARILEWVAIFFLPGIFPTQGLNHISCTVRQVCFFFLTTEPPGKPIQRADSLKVWSELMAYSLTQYVSSSQMNIFCEASPNLYLCILFLPIDGCGWRLNHSKCCIESTSSHTLSLESHSNPVELALLVILYKSLNNSTNNWGPVKLSDFLKVT